MKKIIGVLLFILSIQVVSAQKITRLIIRGDDMGYSHSGNEAIMKVAKDGIQQSIEIIVPSPWFPEAVRLLNEHPDLDVG
ncbi:MAG: ChbG/HpnK family deacetylase, partial [Chitinophagaceae bacterium]|nr:ChbG/HpnK family deacetylase [Chitinophagaceae bacterium]